MSSIPIMANEYLWPTPPQDASLSEPNFHNRNLSAPYALPSSRKFIHYDWSQPGDRQRTYGSTSPTNLQNAGSRAQSNL